MEFHRRADARRLATCDDHRNDGVYASVADILYIRRTRVCAAERFFSTYGVGLAGYRLKASMTGNRQLPIAAASPLLLAKHLPPGRAKPQFGTYRHGGVEGHLDF